MLNDLPYYLDGYVVNGRHCDSMAGMSLGRLTEELWQNDRLHQQRKREKNTIIPMAERVEAGGEKTVVWFWINDGCLRQDRNWTLQIEVMTGFGEKRAAMSSAEPESGDCSGQGSALEGT